MQMSLGIILILAYLFFMFLFVHWKKDNYAGNFTWGIGCVLIALYTFFTGDEHMPRHMLITALTVLWGVRLGVYFYSRYHKGVNPRFLAWQQTKGSSAVLISFAWIFLGQGLLMLIMSLPIVAVNLSKVPGFSILDIIAVILWAIGFYFESISDYQLYHFIKDPSNKGHIMESGLWHYSRHPNYFGEILMWWCIYALALPVNYGMLTIIAPLTITLLLLFVTGVPVNEAPMKDNAEYQEYKKRTNMLIPWWPKHD